MAAGTMEEIGEFLKTVRFQRRFLGGISEEDVWRKLEKLEEQYQAVFEAQRIRYETLLEERDRELAELRKQVHPPADTAQGEKP